jgi:hypothetical protein
MPTYYCTECGRQRTARRCGCWGTHRDVVRWLEQAHTLRLAAEIHPPSAEANLADAARLERLALQGAA